MIAADLAEGRLPAAIVATVGTTGTTAADPIAAIAEVARQTASGCMSTPRWPAAR